jgi:integrase
MGTVGGQVVAAIRKLPSGRYRVRWRDAEGREHGQTVPTKKLALQRKAEVEIQAAQGSVRDPRRGRIGFGTFLRRSLEHAEGDLRPATLALYRTQAEQYVLPELGGMQLAAIEPADLRDFYRKLQRSGVGKPTVEVVHRLVSRTFAIAIDDGLVVSNPAARAKAPRAQRKPTRVLSREEVCRIVYSLDRIAWVKRQWNHVWDHQLSGRANRANRALENEDADWMRRELDVISRVCASDEERISYVLMDKAQRETFLEERGQDRVWPVGDAFTDEGLNAPATMAILAAFTGLRFGEAAALRRRHLRLDDKRPRVEVTEALTEVQGTLTIGPTKTDGSRRSVPIASEPVSAAMRDYVRELQPDDLLFTGRDGGLMSRTRFRARFWQPAVLFAGISPEPGFHDLRHSYAAWMIESNVHPKRLQERLGHTSIRTTLDIYGHLMASLESEDSDLDDLLQRPSRGTYVARDGNVLRAVEDG